MAEQPGSTRHTCLSPTAASGRSLAPATKVPRLLALTTLPKVPPQGRLAPQLVPNGTSRTWPNRGWDQRPTRQG